ncbi:MAG: type I-E CRISPR-associated protein Cse1/CasA [Chlorobiales bacterium]|nr:type I-E CRISPR-associated protein Cse1/CasA [Chlorobiales bacterium]
MTPENRFNLIDEPWIPVIDKGRLSLRQVFSEAGNRGLGGNPLQKMSMTKLLLAIAQAASTLEDDEALETLESIELAHKCIDYLDKWHDQFWLYGEKPFLQMPAINGLIERRKRKELAAATNDAGRRNAEASARPKSIGMGFYPDLPADNNTILTQYQVPKVLSDADKALFVVSLMNFALGGKRAEKNLDTLTEGYTGKTGSAKSSPSIGNYIGYLHSILVGETLIDTLLLNLLSRERIRENAYWKTGLGTAPWEQMPEGEAGPIADSLKSSYMATLVSLSRFVLLKGYGIYYVEGMQYPSHKDGWREPSMAVNAQGTTPKIKWIDPNKRPWRELASLLRFMSAGGVQGYDCQFIRYGLVRFRSRFKRIGVWSGGLRVSTNAGDQSVKQDDDFVESIIFLESNILGEPWYHQLQIEMEALDKLSTRVYASTNGFFKAQNMTDSGLAGQASSIFWELCERRFQDLVDACAPTQNTIKIRQSFAQSAIKAYDSFCPRESARQIDAWAKNRPNLNDYLNQ